MGERRKPEDYRLRWRCAREIKDALREFGGPQRVGDPDLIPASHWYKAQAGDESSFLFRYCASILTLNNAEAHSAIVRLHAFTTAFVEELLSDVPDDRLEDLAEQEISQDADADAATLRAARKQFSDVRSLEEMARERRKHAAVALIAAAKAERRAMRLRAAL